MYTVFAGIILYVWSNHRILIKALNNEVGI